MAKKPNQTELTKALNYARAYISEKQLTDYLGISKQSLNNIARGQTKKVNPKTQMKIYEAFSQAHEQVRERQAEFMKRANDKRLSRNSRSLAKDRARDLAKNNYSYNEATKRQKLLRERPKSSATVADYLPYVRASTFLSHYSEGKSDVQLRNELDRFTERGKELLVTNYNGDVFFSRKPLKPGDTVHPRGVVYVNNFSAGINQIVRDLTGLYEDQQTLGEAQQDGREYFDQCFEGGDHKDVNVKFLNGGMSFGKGIRSRGEKYEDLSKWLTERLYLGVYLY